MLIPNSHGIDMYSLKVDNQQEQGILLSVMQQSKWEKNLQKTRSWHPVLSLYGKWMGKQWQTLFSWAANSLQMVTAAVKLKDTCSLEQKLWQI